MNFIGPIDGINFSPIADYNKYLKVSDGFEVNSDFETILSKQKDLVGQNLTKLNGGLELNMNIDDLTPGSTEKNTASAGTFIKSLGRSLGGGLSAANDANVAAEKAQEAMAMGENVSVHDVMIASEKAALSMQMTIQLRNKLISAYNEINGIKV